MRIFGIGDEKVNVIVEVQAKTGCEEAVRAMLTAQAAAALEEKGCKVYRLHEDKASPGLFFTYEEWGSETALKEHLIGVKQTMEQAKPLLEGLVRVSVVKLLA
jgi:quinol monooxygenase YgiN